MTCPVCGADASREALASFPAFKCDCGFIFAAPGAGSSDPQLYDEQWSKSVVHPTYLFANGGYVVRNSWKLEALLDRLEPFRQLNHILDVGCSAAFFLRLAKDRGWNVQGVEVTEWAATFSREKLGVPVFQGLLHDAAFPEASFDVAFSSHVLEHIEQPRALLQELHRVLRPGGVLVIVVPTQFRSPLYVCFKEWFGEGPPRHVSFFNQRSLTRLLNSCGFQDVRCRHNVELQPILRRLRHRPAPAANGTRNDRPSAPKVETSPSIVARSIKGLINRLGGGLDIGDELWTTSVRK